MIGLIGATGFTGRLVAVELQRQQAEFLIAGRNELLLEALSRELGGIEACRIDVRDKSTFSWFERCNVIINCAGPFTDLGELVVQEAIACKAHYLDLTGEQSFIKLVYDKYHESALAAGVALVPACAFEYAIGDAIAAVLCANIPGCSKVEVVYHLTSAHMSAGTRKSIIRALAASGYQFTNGKLIESAPAAIVKNSHIDNQDKCLISFPAGEVLMLPRHQNNLREVQTFMTADLPSAVPSSVLSVLANLAIFSQLLVRPIADLLVKSVSTKSPSLSQRQITGFLIRVSASSDTTLRQISIAGTDPYYLTAVIAAGVANFMAKSRPKNLGAITPAMVESAGFIISLICQPSPEELEQGHWTCNV